MKLKPLLLALIGIMLCHADKLDAKDSPPATPARSLGRLFHSPETRTDLEAKRRRIEPEPPQTFVGRLSLNGLVRRDGGRATVWINGKIQENDRLIVHPDTNSVLLNDGNGEIRELKVGESIEFQLPRQMP